MEFSSVHLKFLFFIVVAILNWTVADDASADVINCGHFQCTQEGYYGDANDCKKFHRCVDYTGTGESYTNYVFECNGTLEYDPLLYTCNDPENIESSPCRICNDKGRIAVKRTLASGIIQTLDQNPAQ